MPAWPTKPVRCDIAAYWRETNFTVTFPVEMIYPRFWRQRLAVGTWLMYLGAWVMGAGGIEMEIPEDTCPTRS